MNKAKLPVKTKIAVWWIRIIAALVAIGGLIVIFVTLTTAADIVKEEEIGILFFVVVTIVLPIWLLFLLPSILLVLKKPWGWTASTITLSSEIMGVLGVCIYFAITEGLYYLQYTPATIFLLVPLILIILDRKNYFEMIRQRELEKKDPELHPGD
jgi:hypothetical protein